jgi:hypothetical protein
MKKIICMLLFIQSGFMMAQTETLVTPNGKKVTIYPSAPGTADNGLTITSGNIQFGGSLVKPSVLTTTAANTLAIPGLQAGAKADEIVTMDANGVLRKITNNSWDINGNAGTTAGTNFIGTKDNQDLIFKRNSQFAGIISEQNTSFGFSAYNDNSTGKNNIAFGNVALHSNTTGNNNTGIGNMVLQSNTIGSENVAVGATALSSIVKSYYNTAVGSNSLLSLTTGSDNVAIGGESGTRTGTFISGARTIVTAIDDSIIIGYDASPLDNGDYNEIVIGSAAIGRGSNSVTIGNANMTSIGGYTAWSNYSDSRLKKNIVSSTYGLDFINKLRPVLYNMKTGTTELQTGFIAQEVEAAANSIGYKFSGVVKPQSDNDYYALSYASFVVPLVKAVQEQQTQIETLQKELNDLKAVVQKLIDTK